MNFSNSLQYYQIDTPLSFRGYNILVMDDYYDSYNTYSEPEPLDPYEYEEEAPNYYPYNTPIVAQAPTLRLRMALLMVAVVLLTFPATQLINALRGANTEAYAVQPAVRVADAPLGSAAASVSKISPLFTDEVQHWGAQITHWSELYGADPNMIATIMQIESCGDPQAQSHAGAQGLFQVMPFHFTDGENMLDPDTNAKRGIHYFLERMEQTNGDVGRSFAGYNGGHGAAGSPWEEWPNETQRYYYWATGIYNEIQANATTSETLGEWLTAGGYSLCAQAAARLGLTP